MISAGKIPPSYDVPDGPLSPHQITTAYGILDDGLPVEKVVLANGTCGDALGRVQRQFLAHALTHTQPITQGTSVLGHEALEGRQAATSTHPARQRIMNAKLLSATDLAIPAGRQCMNWHDLGSETECAWLRVQVLCLLYTIT